MKRERMVEAHNTIIHAKSPTITNLRYMCKLNLITISETEDYGGWFKILNELCHLARQA